MAILELKYYGASVLQREAKPIKRIDREILDLAHNMLESMYHYQGVGLAAPQVGVSKQMIVIDCGEDFQKEPLVLINPEIVSTQGVQFGPEGCLSLPELYMDVERPAQVTIRFMNIQGESETITGKGLLARAILHEIDHLNGRLFTELVAEKEKLGTELPLLKERIRQILSGERPAILQEEAVPEPVGVAS